MTLWDSVVWRLVWWCETFEVNMSGKHCNQVMGAVQFLQLRNWQKYSFSFFLNLLIWVVFFCPTLCLSDFFYVKDTVIWILLKIFLRAHNIDGNRTSSLVVELVFWLDLFFGFDEITHLKTKGFFFRRTFLFFSQADEVTHMSGETWPDA